MPSNTPRNTPRTIKAILSRRTDGYLGIRYEEPDTGNKICEHSSYDLSDMYHSMAWMEFKFGALDVVGDWEAGEEEIRRAIATLEEALHVTLGTQR